MGRSANLAALTRYSATLAVQETHLTAQGNGRFKKELAAPCGSPSEIPVSPNPWEQTHDELPL